MEFKIYVPVGCQTVDPLDDSMDVNIIINNMDVYFATLFTIKNIEKLLLN
jgi:hypothetical protein